MEQPPDRPPETTQEIARLNDLLRKDPVHGRVVLTIGVSNLPQADQTKLFRKVQGFSDFNTDNDPHGEHDFGQIEFDGQEYFFKIDYYNKDLQYHSPDPTDPSVTERVMTIMRADEH